MNRTSFRQFLIVIVLILSAASYGQLKIAVVSTNEAAMATEEAKEKLTEIEEQFAPETDRLKGLQEELFQLREQLLNDSAVTSDDERRDIQKKLEDLQFDLEVGAQKLQRDLTEQRDELLRTLNPKFQKALRDLVELENYDVVYQYNPNVFLFVNPRHDITRKITESMNDIQE